VIDHVLRKTAHHTCSFVNFVQPCSVPLLSLSLSLSLTHTHTHTHNACTAESTDLYISNPGSFCSFCVTNYNPPVSTKTEPCLNLLSNSNDPAKEFCDHAHNCNNSAFVLPYVLNLKPSASKLPKFWYQASATD
jgi:hypothetical protein